MVRAISYWRIALSGMPYSLGKAILGEAEAVPQTPDPPPHVGTVQRRTVNRKIFRVAWVGLKQELLFFAIVASPDRNETHCIAMTDMHRRPELSIDHPDHFVTILAILRGTSGSEDNRSPPRRARQRRVRHLLAHGIEPPRPRVEAVRVVDGGLPNLEAAVETLTNSRSLLSSVA